MGVIGIDLSGMEEDLAVLAQERGVSVEEVAGQLLHQDIKSSTQSLVGAAAEEQGTNVVFFSRKRP